MCSPHPFHPCCIQPHEADNINTLQVDYVKGQSLIHIGVLFAMFRATQRCTEATYFDAMLREFKHGFVTALSTEKEKQLGVSNEKLVWGAYLMLLRNGLIRYVDPK